MNEMREALISAAPMELNDTQIDTFCAFGAALLKQNEVMNLTAITDPALVGQLHFADCLHLIPGRDWAGKAVIDVGCGAGFPGVPLKIGAPEIRLTLLDSLGKRMRWLEEILPGLGIEATCVTARAEEFAMDHWEAYDAATSRAVARLNVLCELCLPLVKVGGRFIALKGSAAKEEAAEAANAIKVLGGKLIAVHEYQIAGAAHALVEIKKIAHTPGIYPRKYGKIKQKPL